MNVEGSCLRAGYNSKFLSKYLLESCIPASHVGNLGPTVPPTLSVRTCFRQHNKNRQHIVLYFYISRSPLFANKNLFSNWPINVFLDQKVTLHPENREQRFYDCFFS